MRAWLERRLARMFPAFARAKTTHFWSCLVCLSARLTPMIGQVADDPGVWYGLAYHGNGVGTATWAGRQIARAIAGRSDAARLPAVVAGPPLRFPFPSLRRWYLRAAYLGYRIKDAS
jgi:glycine/D-amino acid oxidase-like deaminating enzyme